MKSRGNGKAKKTVSKVLSDPMDKMSVGKASSKGDVPGFKKGGKIPFGKDFKKDAKKDAKKDDAKMACGGKAYAKGGSVTRADGCISKGHTKGKSR
jgi:hypothetical protein